MTESRWSDAVLDPMRLQMDPLADEAVAEVYSSGSLDAVNELLVHLVTNEQPVPDALPEPIRRFLRESGQLPDWADPKLIERGEQAFLDVGPLCLLALFAGSLPTCYAMRHAVVVLGTTQQLEAHTTRRLLETAQLVVDVMHRGGLAPGGAGIRAAQRVRLLHGAIRHLLLASPDPEPKPPRHFGDVLRAKQWDRANGMPICQEDMGGTVLAFSWIVINSLERMKQDLSPEDRQAYYHCWRVVGHVMGLHEDLLPERVEDGHALLERMLERQQGPSELGELLTERLLKTLYELIVERLADGLPLSRHLPRLLLREVLEPSIADDIGVKPLSLFERFAALPFLHFLLDLANFANRVSGSTRYLHRIQNEAAWKLVMRLAELPRGDGRGLFAMPSALLDHWEPPTGGAR